MKDISETQVRFYQDLHSIVSNSTQQDHSFNLKETVLIEFKYYVVLFSNFQIGIVRTK